jgi:hypothetical protein
MGLWISAFLLMESPEVDGVRRRGLKTWCLGLGTASKRGGSVIQMANRDQENIELLLFCGIRRAMETHRNEHANPGPWVQSRR